MRTAVATNDKWLLAILNSPLMWYYLHRVTIHAINETLRLKNLYMEALPIASASKNGRAEAEYTVEQLIVMAQERKQERSLILDWICTEFDVQIPGTRLENFVDLDAHTFVEEVRKGRSKKAGRLTLAALKELQTAYAQQIVPLQQKKSEAAQLERKLSDLVNAAYGLTPEEVALLWATAPPRMPLPQPL